MMHEMTTDPTASLESQIADLTARARAVSYKTARLETRRKNTLLLQIAEALYSGRTQEELLAANHHDLDLAREKGISGAMLDRLTLDESRIGGMIQGLEEVAELPDPVGTVRRMWTRPNGLKVGKKTISLGVIGIIYEARPNVTIDAFALCFKAGNTTILKGGSEAIHSNRALIRVISGVLEPQGVGDACQLMDFTDREALSLLLQREEDVDLLIPRGGEGLIRFVTKNSRIPVIKHYKGVCHVYVDEGADLDMAVRIVENAKVSRPGVCNALETLLVHEKIAGAFLPLLVEHLDKAGVEIRGDKASRAILPQASAATEEDYYAEYLDLILAVSVVGGLQEAVEHIEKYGSSHTEAIVTNHYGRAQQFLDQVNSSVVIVNASTRFSDGGQLGLGAEIGISTTKLHAFGPMGLEDLVTEKFIIYGEGQVRS